MYRYEKRVKYYGHIESTNDDDDRSECSFVMKKNVD